MKISMKKLVVQIKSIETFPQSIFLTLLNFKTVLNLFYMEILSKLTPLKGGRLEAMLREKQVR